MADTPTKAPAKPKAAPKPKAEAVAPVKEAAPVAAKPAAKPVKSGATVTVRQTGSPIGRPKYQRETLKGLGLNKIGRSRTLEDTSSVRGMIAAVSHLVAVTEDKQKTG